ncbi:MAG TPA: methyltransferase domain-containing protein [Streptosporangiaceae bacterium]|jgi:SAM-dependent methyltransferase
MAIRVNTQVRPERTGGRVPHAVGAAVRLAKVAAQPQTPLMLVMANRLVTPVYRAAFLAAAASTGMLRWMAIRPCDVDSLADQLGIEDKRRLRLWLDTGVRLGDFGERYGCYRLKSRSAKLLARTRNDALAAGLEEVLRYHLPALLSGPDMLRTGSRFSMEDQDGTVIARSTRIVQPLVEQVVAKELDRTEPVRLLEIGCGSAIYVRYAARLNPKLSAVAVDLQDDVVELATRNVAEWGLTDRVQVRQGDLRTLDLEPTFDLITMHNNIYYFTDDERADVLRRARSMLGPGGKLLLTSSCQGGHVSLDVLNVWLEYADFGGSLPRADRLVEQLREAGFGQVQGYRVVPGEQFRAFTGVNA